jgi:hypothetical protein
MPFRPRNLSGRQSGRSVNPLTSSSWEITKGGKRLLASLLRKSYSRQRPTLPHRYQCSTIGPGGVYFRVRNGNGCGPSGIATGNPLMSKVKGASAQTPRASAVDLDLGSFDIIVAGSIQLPLKQ